MLWASLIVVNDMNVNITSFLQMSALVTAASMLLVFASCQDRAELAPTSTLKPQIHRKGECHDVLMG